MGVVIQASGLSKRYTIGNTAGGYSRLTEDITDSPRACCVESRVSVSRLRRVSYGR